MPKTLTEEWSYDMTLFIADFGGSLGFLLGVSILSVLEIVEGLTISGYQLYKEGQRKKKALDEEDDDNDDDEEEVDVFVYGRNDGRLAIIDVKDEGKASEQRRVDDDSVDADGDDDDESDGLVEQIKRRRASTRRGRDKKA